MLKRLLSRGLPCLLLSASLFACGDKDASPNRDGSIVGRDAAGSLVGAERMTFDTGARTTNGVAQTALLADIVTDLNALLMPTGTAEANAAAIQARLDMLRTGCGTVTLDGTTLTVAFGSAGCTLMDGSWVAGSMTIGVQVGSGSVSLTLTLNEFIVRGVTMNGTVMITTSNGTMYSIGLNVSANGQMIAGSITLTVSSSSTTVDGAMQVPSQSGGQPSQLIFGSVVYRIGDCYPSGGMIRIEAAGAPAMVVTFDAATANTGVVHVTIGPRTVDESLPAYGSCPITG